MSMSSNDPEYLDTAGPTQPPAGGSDTRKRVIALGAMVGVGAVVAAGAWAATSFFATGAQPAEALPASTIAYLSVDLDPSGAQKVEAIQTLRKFPAFRDEIDLDTDDDLRERMFEEITKSGECEGLEFAEDVEPWLGSRAAVAAVDTGKDQPSPVVVIQVTDANGAEDGIANLVETCGGAAGSDADTDDSGAGGWVVDGDWAVMAESEEIAQQVVDATEKADLASDDAFTRWTGEAGDEGIISMYASAEVTDFADELMSVPGNPLAPIDPLVMPDSSGDSLNEDFTDEFEEPTAEVPEEVQKMLEDFEGAAATVRFDDGALEIEFAASNYNEDLTKHFANQAGVDLVGGLPANTVAAFGMGLEDGWAQAVIDYFAATMSAGEDPDEMIAEAEEETGLELPEDLETLFGDGVALSLGDGIDPDAIANGGPEEVPFGLKIAGDADDIQAVLDKLEDLDPELAPYLEVESGDGFAVISPHEDYKGDLVEKGSLRDSDAYKEVIESDEAQSVLFVDFDADDDWLVRLAEDDPKASDNLAPLSAVGMSSWVDGDVAHGLLKLTTD